MKWNMGDFFFGCRDAFVVCFLDIGDILVDWLVKVLGFCRLFCGCWFLLPFFSVLAWSPSKNSRLQMCALYMFRNKAKNGTLYGSKYWFSGFGFAWFQAIALRVGGERLELSAPLIAVLDTGTTGAKLLWGEMFFSPEILKLLWMDKIRLTTKHDDYPMSYRVLTIPGGAGFLPSTVSFTPWCFLRCGFCYVFFVTQRLRDYIFGLGGPELNLCTCATREHPKGTFFPNDDRRVVAFFMFYLHRKSVLWRCKPFSTTSSPFFSHFFW